MRKKELLKKLEDTATAFGGTFDSCGDYPAWEYRSDSPLRDKMVRIFEEQYGHEPEVTVIHAGLECGILLEKNPKLDAISFAFLMMKKLYDADVIVPTVIKDKVAERVKEISKQIGLDK